ncbi:hypothetical protein M3568_18135 [Priestia flexa]|uniref:TcaA NTF2-like domain-containing protein n=1 Tax=Priestia flexa TaxID=86664 RepID=UPI0020417BF3|nr:hypothetical protein [Priestia flexa]MCM3068249.1 hypothetical protein [Priestia flexa]
MFVLKSIILSFREGFKYQHLPLTQPNEKGITEELHTFDVKNVKDLGDGLYEVSTYEEYTISYVDGTSKQANFNTVHQVKDSDGELGVYKLVKTTETN